MAPGLPRRAAAALIVFAVAAFAPPAAGFDLFATHEVTARFATRDGRPLAGAEVRLFAPGEPKRPVRTGRTDSDGKFVFPADRDGFWSVEARTGNEVQRVMIRVGGPSQQQRRVSPVLVLGLLAVLLAVVFWYRFLRLRRGGRR